MTARYTHNLIEINYINYMLVDFFFKFTITQLKIHLVNLNEKVTYKHF